MLADNRREWEGGQHRVSKNHLCDRQWMPYCEGLSVSMRLYDFVCGAGCAN
jgi:hypothetical protein